MKLAMEIISALLVGMSVVNAAPLERHARADEKDKDKDKEKYGTCPPLKFTADERVWTNYYTTSAFGMGDFEYEYIMRGQADMQPLAEIVAEKASDFEEYMEDKNGNFVVLNTLGHVDPFYSMLWKLNAVTAPILMAPYWVERTVENEAAWDEWWNALHELAPSGEKTENTCFPSAEYQWFKPWAVTFPTHDAENYPTNWLYMNQTTVDYATTRVWEVALAAQYPPSLTCEVGVEGAAASAGEGVEGLAAVGAVQDTVQNNRIAAQAILDHLDTDCYSMAPVSGQQNRWQISLVDNC
eukprot:Clim_evm8s98 gene=Clim_evmTU8s98